MESLTHLDRRDFLKKGALSTIGVLFASHLFAQDQSPHSQGKQNLLSEIRLKTKVTSEKLVDFYNGLLGLKVLTKTQSACSFQAGNSVLNFTCNPNEADAPFYHFAFNIPEKKIRQAEKWQLERTALIEPPDHLKDLNNYSKNIVHFRHWNAHSIFFYDPAGNVVEYIARHSYPNPAKGEFSSNDILYISEIGLVVDHVEEIYQKISNHFGIKKYSTSSDRFLAMGNELGLILLMAKHTRAVFKKGRQRNVYETEIHLNLEDPKSRLDFENYPYRIFSV